MNGRLWFVAGVLSLAVMVPACTPGGLKAGNEPLVVRILPEGEWRACKVYINGEFVDTAGPGADQRDYKVAPGRYKIRLDIDNYEPCEETVTVVGGMGGRNYFEFRPKPLR